MGGSMPKQFRLLRTKPVLRWSVDVLLERFDSRDIVVVVAASEMQLAEGLLAGCGLTIVAGGTTRTESVRNGLAALADPPPLKVLVHDAARPGLSVGVVDELIAALENADAAAPAMTTTDALKQLGPDGSLTTLTRESLYRVQTPQAFRFDLIKAAIDRAGEAAVDDLALVEQSGARVVLTPGRPELMKITHEEDFAVVEKLIGSPAPSPALRVGTGFDVHRFEAGNGVVLCGVKVSHSHALQGHSDADVGWHALTDAILGAAALGDIGDHFPPSDPQWRGAASLTFLKYAVMLAAERGYRVVNADITLLCEKPKIAPHREAMRAATAEALGIAVDAVSVKATTTERLGFVGREEGIAAQAAVLLSQ